MVKMLMFDIKKTEREFLTTFDTSDFEISYFSQSLNHKTKLTLKDYDETAIISVFITSCVTKEVLDKFKNLRVIVTRSVCFKHIDTDECRRRNIAVINVEDYARDAISQYVIGLAFNLTRNISVASEDVKKGVFDFERYESENIDKLSIGVIGTGSVGSAVCELAHRLGMKVQANDFVINKNISSYVEYMSLNDVMRKSDIVSIHIPYNKDCYHMISDSEIDLMKEGSYIINTCEPDIIDKAALYRALKTKKLKGAALDMIIKYPRELFAKESVKAEYNELEEIIIRQKLIEQENVIITPRISYDTKDCIIHILKSNFHSIKDYYAGRKTNRIV